MDELKKIQAELKAPKGQYNSFGKYHYRSAEDILEAVKPLLTKYGVLMTITDDVIAVADRIYVKATVTIENSKGVSKTVNAYAREPQDKNTLSRLASRAARTTHSSLQSARCAESLLRAQRMIAACFAALMKCRRCATELVFSASSQGRENERTDIQR